MAAAGGRPAFRFSATRWRMAWRMPVRNPCGLNAKVSRARFGFPSLMPEADAGSLIAKA
jgi:hypothetical protein